MGGGVWIVLLLRQMVVNNISSIFIEHVLVVASTWSVKYALKLCLLEICIRRNKFVFTAGTDGDSNVVATSFVIDVAVLVIVVLSRDVSCFFYA